LPRIQTVRSLISYNIHVCPKKLIAIAASQGPILNLVLAFAFQFLPPYIDGVIVLRDPCFCLSLMGVHQESGLVLQAVRGIYIRAAVLIVSTCRITKANLAGWQHPFTLQPLPICLD